MDNVRSEKPGGGPAPQEKRGRSLRLASAPLVVICGLVVAFEFSSMATAMISRSDSYSLAAANVTHLLGSGCNLSDKVLVERDPSASVLSALPTAQQTTVDKPVESTVPGLPPRYEGNGPAQDGFHLAPINDEDPLYKPPHGFNPATVPMWSSYQDRGGRTGILRTTWFHLGSQMHDGQLVIAAAHSTSGVPAVKLAVEFGRYAPAGIDVLATIDEVSVPGPTSSASMWGDVRVELRGKVPADADTVRLVAEDNDLRDEGWVALSAPRFPTLTTLTDRVGTAPVYMDWPVPFVFPCLNPPKMHDGILELPAYRITSDPLVPGAGWSNTEGGGPLGQFREVADEPEIPTYLVGDPDRKWGQLLGVDLYVPGVAPTVVHDEEVRPGWWSPGRGPDMPRAGG